MQMTSVSSTPNKPVQGSISWAIGLILMVSMIYGGSLAALVLSQTPFGSSSAGALSSMFALGTTQASWYVTRAAGLTSYFLVWLSMVWGLAVSSKAFQGIIHGSDSYDFHEFLSLLGLGFIGLHVGALMLDKYMPFSIWQILIPFSNAYRPLWVGIGIICFYILVLVSMTFYMRRRISMQAFRSIHLLSFLGYLGATLHGLFAGTDSALPVTRLLYAGTFLMVVFLTVYWLVLSALDKQEKTMREARVPSGRQSLTLTSGQE
jgi:predicted ferric reductase